MAKSFFVALVFGFSYLPAAVAQNLLTSDDFRPTPPNSATPINDHPLAQQRDLVDVARTVLSSRFFKGRDTTKLQSGRPLIWIIPQVGYSRQTGFLAEVLGNVTFRRPGANVSNLVSMISYTQQNQQLFTNTLSLWLANNSWNLTADLRLMHYPQATFGLGMHTNTDRVINMDYDYQRSYVTLLRRLAPNLYGGLGLQLDLHWNIASYDGQRERVRISRYSSGVMGRSVSVGPVISVLYDNRPNSINALRGFYANAVFRQNLIWLGSDSHWQSLLLDVRKYIPLSRSKPETVLALWSYNVVTVGGNPPFLDLPSTSWDTNSSTGRGYIQGRFRGKDFLYAEAELRFGITANRLLGGVVFVNAQSASETNSTANPEFHFDSVAPAGGLGLRVRMNKLSRTNLAIDYGFGIEGSRGLAFNLGEVF